MLLIFVIFAKVYNLHVWLSSFKIGINFSTFFLEQTLLIVIFGKHLVSVHVDLVELLLNFLQSLFVFSHVVKVGENCLHDCENNNQATSKVVAPSKMSLDVENIEEESHEDGNILESSHCS